ncbi:MAG: tetratricopeptide repeat protein [Fusicatenibacter saccharivorans]
MNCMNCKSVVDVGMEICPNCGFNLRVQRKCFSLSNMYYNLGLDKAEIRDLSGAIDMLRRSLKFNKYNIHARNLLGLVYFETGEAVAALSEWIISKNIMPENNVATEYIATLQAEQAKLDMINQTIKKYNSALKCCRENNEDVAAIQLRKILNQNPKLIKGYHLLALIYIHKGEYEKARKILKKAAKIDKTNSTTLRFLKEVDFQTGTQTSLEPRRFGRRERTEEQREDERERVVSGDTVIIPPTFRETSTAATMLNIGIGLVLGALVVWFLIGPANTQRINRQADEKVVGIQRKDGEPGGPAEPAPEPGGFPERNDGFCAAADPDGTGYGGFLREPFESSGSAAAGQYKQCNQCTDGGQPGGPFCRCKSRLRYDLQEHAVVYVPGAFAVGCECI